MSAQPTWSDGREDELLAHLDLVPRVAQAALRQPWFQRVRTLGDMHPYDLRNDACILWTSSDIGNLAFAAHYGSDAELVRWATSKLLRWNKWTRKRREYRSRCSIFLIMLLMASNMTYERSS